MKVAAWASVVCALLAACEPSVPSSPAGDERSGDSSPAGNLLTNGGFEHGFEGWRITAGAEVDLVTDGGHQGGQAVSIRPESADRFTLTSEVAATGLPAGEQVEGEVWVRANRLGQRFQLVVTEHLGDEEVSSVAQLHRSADTQWHPVSTTVLTEQADTRLVFRVTADNLVPGKTIEVDAAELTHLSDPDVKLGAQPRRLSNGCAVSPRGIPICSAYMGGSFLRNADPAPWELSLQRTIGVRRTYYDWDQVDYAVRTAREDLRRRRLPWVSFKLPHSWSEMASGRGDEWVRSTALELARLPGPVWVAFHHEPEGDGDVSKWTAMQERLAPIVRRIAPNVGYTIILTGWNQLYGEPQYRFDAIWPHGIEVDLVAFDVYNMQGVRKNGRRYGEATQMAAYFEPLSRWAEEHGVAWGLSEAGYTTLAAKRDPAWIYRTYQELVAADGVVFSYFNSNANSIASWALNTERKQRQFRFAMQGTPTL